MNATTLCIFIWGIYVLVMGLLLVLIPGKTLILCEQENPKDHWARIPKIMIISLGYFYLNAAHNEVYSFYQASIVARFAGIVGFIGLAIFKMAKPRRIFDYTNTAFHGHIGIKHQRTENTLETTENKGHEKNYFDINFGLLPALLMAQELTQTLEGKMIDTDTRATLPGANIIIVGSNSMIGASSDMEGNFKMSNVPVGQHTFKVMYVGYEEVYLNEIQVGSGREVVLNICRVCSI